MLAEVGGVDSVPGSVGCRQPLAQQEPRPDFGDRMKLGWPDTAVWPAGASGVGMTEAKNPEG